MVNSAPLRRIIAYPSASPCFFSTLLLRLVGCTAVHCRLLTQSVVSSTFAELLVYPVDPGFICSSRFNGALPPSPPPARQLQPPPSPTSCCVPLLAGASSGSSRLPPLPLELRFSKVCNFNLPDLLHPFLCSIRALLCSTPRRFRLHGACQLGFDLPPATLYVSSCFPLHNREIHALRAWPTCRTTICQVFMHFIQSTSTDPVVSSRISAQSAPCLIVPLMAKTVQHEIDKMTSKSSLRSNKCVWCQTRNNCSARHSDSPHPVLRKTVTAQTKTMKKDSTHLTCVSKEWERTV